MTMHENASIEPGGKTATKDIDATLQGIDVESLLADLGQKIELTVKRALTEVQTQSKTYVSEAEARVKTAEHYFTDQVRAKPVTTMSMAIGAGVLLGLLLSSGRKR